MFCSLFLQYFVIQGMLGPSGKPGRNGEPGKPVRTGYLVLCVLLLLLLLYFRTFYIIYSQISRKRTALTLETKHSFPLTGNVRLKEVEK